MRPIKACREDPGNCSAFSDPAIVEMCFMIFLDVEATPHPSDNVLKGWHAMGECAELSPALVLCKMPCFEKHG